MAFFSGDIDGGRRQLWQRRLNGQRGFSCQLCRSCQEPYGYLFTSREMTYREMRSMGAGALTANNGALIGSMGYNTRSRAEAA